MPSASIPGLSPLPSSEPLFCPDPPPHRPQRPRPPENPASCATLDSFSLGQEVFMPSALATCGVAGLTVALLAAGASRSRWAKGFDPAEKVGSDLSEQTQVCLPAWLRTSCPLEPRLVVGAVGYPSKGHLASLWGSSLLRENQKHFPNVSTEMFTKKRFVKSFF